MVLLIELIVQLRISTMYTSLKNLHKILLHSHHLLGQTHFIGVCDPHVGIHVGSCAIQDDEQTLVSRVDKRSDRYERVLLISEQ